MWFFLLTKYFLLGQTDQGFSPNAISTFRQYKSEDLTIEQILESPEGQLVCWRRWSEYCKSQRKPESRNYSTEAQSARGKRSAEAILDRRGKGFRNTVHGAKITITKKGYAMIHWIDEENNKMYLKLYCGYETNMIQDRIVKVTKGGLELEAENTPTIKLDINQIKKSEDGQKLYRMWELEAFPLIHKTDPPPRNTALIIQGRPLPTARKPIHTDICEGDALYILREYITNLSANKIVISMAYKENQYAKYLEKVKFPEDNVEFFIPSFTKFLADNFSGHPYYQYFADLVVKMGDKASHTRKDTLNILKQLKDEEDGKNKVPLMSRLDKLTFRPPKENAVTVNELYLK